MKTENKTELKVYDSPLVEVVSLRLTSGILEPSQPGYNDDYEDGGEL